MEEQIDSRSLYHTPDRKHLKFKYKNTHKVNASSVFLSKILQGSHLLVHQRYPLIKPTLVPTRGLAPPLRVPLFSANGVKNSKANTELRYELCLTEIMGNVIGQYTVIRFTCSLVLRAEVYRSIGH